MSRKNYRKQNRQRRKQEQRQPAAAKVTVASRMSEPTENGGTRVTTTYSDGRVSVHTEYGKKISKPVGNTAGSTSPSAYSTTGYGTTAWSKTACNHWRDEFLLPTGSKILLSAYSDEPWKAEDRNGPLPDLGFYLDDSWAKSGLLCSPGVRPPFEARESRHANKVVSFPWLDHDIPDDMVEFNKAVDWLLKWLAAGQRVDIGCFGGHGRTGTLLACILVAMDVTPNGAIGMVRSKHCEWAIETDPQEDWVFMFANFRAGKRNLREGIPTRTSRVSAWGSAYAGSAAGSTTGAYGSGYGESTRKSAADDEEYEEWLRLNTMAAYLHGDQEPYDAATDALLLEQKMDAYARDVELMAEMDRESADYQATLDDLERDELDAWCIDGPCAMAKDGGCSIEDNYCWRALVRGAVDNTNERVEILDEYGRRIP